MPRFFFDLQHERDERGAELPDAPTARQLARRYAGELLRCTPADADQSYWRMDVRQGSGPVIFSLVLELLPVATPRHDARRMLSSGEDYV